MATTVDVRDRRPRGFFWAEDEVFDRPSLTSYAKLVYLFLCRRADREALCFPGHKDIAASTGLSVSTVRRALDELRVAGAVQVVHRQQDGAANLYQVMGLRGAPGEQGGALPEQGGCSEGAGGLFPENTEGIHTEGIPSEGKKTYSDQWPSPQSLIELYNEKTPVDHPKVHELSPGRVKKAQEYLQVFPGRGFWERVFEEVSKSDFLRRGSVDRPNFRGDFDWLLTKGKDRTENAVKTAEGKYRGRGDWADSTPPDPHYFKIG